MTERDRLQRFIFENAGVRGEWVSLDASWQTVLQNHDYPENVARQLGQAMAAVVLLSATIKFDGTLVLQAQGEGPLHTLVAQATHMRTVRGLAHWRNPVGRGSLAEVFGAGRLVMTVRTAGAEPYQGIVPLEGGSLADALEAYFSQSEQLRTRFWLAADGERASGLMLQEVPSADGRGDDWDRIVMLADTVTEREMLTLEGQKLLYRLFNEEKVRLFEREPVVFRCGCSTQRIETTLVALGRESLDDILEERDAIEVDCEFCNRKYRFDRVDVERLFAADPKLPASSTVH